MTDVGAFSNSNLLKGTGTIQYNSTVNIPAGGGAGGLFSNTPSVTVGDGTTSNTVTVTASSAINNLIVNTGSTLAFNNSVVLSVAGNLTGTGTSLYGTADVITLNGSAVQNITTNGSFPFPSLTINNSGANFVTLLSSITVNETLNFQAGNIVAGTGAYSVIIPLSGSVTGAGQGTGWVNGNLQMAIPLEVLLQQILQLATIHYMHPSTCS